MQEQILKDPAPDTSAGFSLPSYCLKFADDGLGSRKELQFEAINASKALLVAQEEASNRRAELWCDGRKLCNISHTGAGVWEVSP